jgi:hypothetical protein
MAIEAALVKPIVDVVLAGLKKIKGVKVKKDAASELSEVIRNLLQLSPDINGAEAKIQAAKAAGVISKELVLAEEMLFSVRAKPRVVAKKAAAKHGYVAPTGVAKKPASKKPFAKKSATVAGRKPSAPVAIKKAAAGTIKRAAPATTKRK